MPLKNLCVATNKSSKKTQTHAHTYPYSYTHTRHNGALHPSKQN